MIDMSDISSLFPAASLQNIKNDIAQAEKQGKLTNKQIQSIQEQGLLKAMVPGQYGGKQMSLPELLKIEEALAYIDGSLGWTVTLCSGAGWFGGFLNEEIAAEFLSASNTCIAGSGFMGGTAEMTPDGYVINGRWSYASGANMATAFTANCLVTKNKVAVKNEDGTDKILSFIFHSNEVTLLDDWNAFGMVATASHSFEAKELEVSANRSFAMNVQPVINAALYHFPFMQLAECTLSVNIIGMALHFMELCSTMIDGKKLTNSVTELQDKYNGMLNKLQTSRQKLFYAVDMAWQVCQANKEISPSLLYKVTAASSIAVSVAKDCVNTLYPHCGLKAADKRSEINRVWRDIQTAGQHGMIVSLAD